MARPDPGSGPALAGFRCGLISLGLALLAGLLASGELPGGTSGEGILLLIATIPLALVGLGLSLRGLRSRSRRGLAIAGLTLSCVPLVALALAVLVIYLSWSRCAPSCI